jgi:hypothetical protein
VTSNANEPSRNGTADGRGRSFAAAIAARSMSKNAFNSGSCDLDTVRMHARQLAASLLPRVIRVRGHPDESFVPLKALVLHATELDVGQTLWHGDAFQN